MTEPQATGFGAAFDAQAVSQGSIRLPALDPAAPPGEYVALSRAVPRMSPEQRDRERADAARRYEVRQAAERAALAAGQSALEAARSTDEMLREAREAAIKAAS